MSTGQKASNGLALVRDNGLELHVRWSNKRDSGAFHVDARTPPYLVNLKNIPLRPVAMIRRCLAADETRNQRGAAAWELSLSVKS